MYIFVENESFLFKKALSKSLRLVSPRIGAKAEGRLNKNTKNRIIDYEEKICKFLLDKKNESLYIIRVLRHTRP